MLGSNTAAFWVHGVEGSEAYVEGGGSRLQRDGQKSDHMGSGSNVPRQEDLGFIIRPWETSGG